MVPWVSCATDMPTTVDSVNIEFTSRCPNSCVSDQNASRCRACVFMVIVVKSTLSASVTVRPGRCRYFTSVFELVVVQAALLDLPHVPIVSYRLSPAYAVSPSSREMIMSCTSVVPSPISRIFESR